MKIAVAAVTVLAVVLVAQVYSDEAPVTPPPHITKCMSDNGVTKDDLLKFVSTGEASQDMKCNFKCILMGLGAMKEDGTMDLDVQLAKAAKAPEAMKDAIRECAKIEKSGDLCEQAYQHNKCIREKGGEAFQELSRKRLEGMTN